MGVLWTLETSVQTHGRCWLADQLHIKLTGFARLLQ